MMCPEPFYKIAFLCTDLNPDKRYNFLLTHLFVLIATTRISRPPFEVMEVWLESLSMHLSVCMPIPSDLLFDIYNYRGSSPSSSGSTTPEGIPSESRSPNLKTIKEGKAQTDVTDSPKRISDYGDNKSTDISDIKSFEPLDNNKIDSNNLLKNNNNNNNKYASNAHRNTDSKDRFYEPHSRCDPKASDRLNDSYESSNKYDSKTSDNLYDSKIDSKANNDRLYEPNSRCESRSDPKTSDRLYESCNKYDSKSDSKASDRLYELRGRTEAKDSDRLYEVRKDSKNSLAVLRKVPKTFARNRFRHCQEISQVPEINNISRFTNNKISNSSKFTKNFEASNDQFSHSISDGQISKRNFDPKPNVKDNKLSKFTSYDFSRSYSTPDTTSSKIDCSKNYPRSHSTSDNQISYVSDLDGVSSHNDISARLLMKPAILSQNSSSIYYKKTESQNPAASLDGSKSERDFEPDSDFEQIMPDIVSSCTIKKLNNNTSPRKYQISSSSRPIAPRRCESSEYIKPCASSSKASSLVKNIVDNLNRNDRVKTDGFYTSKNVEVRSKNDSKNSKVRSSSPIESTAL